MSVMTTVLVCRFDGPTILDGTFSRIGLGKVLLVVRRDWQVVVFIAFRK